jgi:formylglycine-generating enzyme required for sulfatase activity
MTSSSSGRLPDGALAPVDGQATKEGGTVTTCSECPEACEGGVCKPWPSCRGSAPLMCGPTKDGALATSCCESKPVPGGKFNRANQGSAPATITGYSLDTYEVTVARFRAFVQSGNGVAGSAPAAGAGANPKVAESGLKQPWSAQLANSTELFENSLSAGTYTKTPGDHDQKPITNVSWFEAFAFCVWDGGRLPTLAEWSFAAAGGDEQRIYPWSAMDAIDKSRAAYECRVSDPPLTCPGPLCVGATPAQTGPCNDPVCVDAGGTCQDPGCSGCDVNVDLAPVGSLPAGAGRWGQQDLSGNVAEIVLDAKPKNSGVLFPLPCVDDCALLMSEQPRPPSGGPDYEFFIMNGDWTASAEEVKTTQFDQLDFRERHDWLGFRCARDR